MSHLESARNYKLIPLADFIVVSCGRKYQIVKDKSGRYLVGDITISKYRLSKFIKEQEAIYGKGCFKFMF